MHMCLAKSMKIQSHNRLHACVYPELLIYLIKAPLFYILLKQHNCADSILFNTIFYYSRVTAGQDHSIPFIFLSILFSR